MMGTTPSLSLALAADNREYPRLQEFVNRACEHANCSPGQRMRVQLVIEELFSNTVKYGSGGAAPVSVTVSVEIRDGDEPLTVRYEDDAPKHDAFDQGDLEDELKASVTRRRVGGLGILLDQWDQVVVDAPGRRPRHEDAGVGEVAGGDPDEQETSHGP